MANYKLTYFDFDGGRGEPIRIALHAAGIEFEDERLAFPDFSTAQPGFRFYAVPVLTVDDAQITQSNAIGRYVGRMAGLYPSDDLQALYCDEVVEALDIELEAEASALVGVVEHYPVDRVLESGFTGLISIIVTAISGRICDLAFQCIGQINNPSLGFEFEDVDEIAVGSVAIGIT